MRLKIDRASLIVGSKFTVFTLFCFVFEGNFPSTRGLYLEGRFNLGFFALPVWGAYISRGLYVEGLIFGILRYKGGRLKRKEAHLRLTCVAQKRLCLSLNTCLTDLTGWMTLCIKESYNLELVFKSLILNSANVAYPTLSTRSARHE